MAEALLKAEPKAEGWLVQSAGTCATDGEPASSGSQNAVRKLGLDLSRHRSRQFTRNHAEESDLIIALTHGHYQQIISQFPFAREKTLLLGSFLNPDPDDGQSHDYDIGDPIGEPDDIYLQTRDTIARAVTRLADYLTTLT